jgi:heat shock protein 5
MSKIIPRNTNIPVTEKQTFSTNADNQESVDVEVYEGERSLTKDNHFLGRFLFNWYSTSSSRCT